MSDHRFSGKRGRSRLGNRDESLASVTPRRPRILSANRPRTVGNHVTITWVASEYGVGEFLSTSNDPNMGIAELEELSCCDGTIFEPLFSVREKKLRVQHFTSNFKAQLGESRRFASQSACFGRRCLLHTRVEISNEIIIRDNSSPMYINLSR